ncbi:MAG: acetyl-CoA carboxylase biotin carboxyl carrier protein [Elusimicrobiota bacterium]
MDIKKIKSVLDAIKDTDIEEIWIEKDGEKSGFRRKPVELDSLVVSKKATPEPQDVLQKSGSEPVQSSALKTSIIKSTMVGTFYRSPTPGGKPLAEEGDFVTVGQKVGIVEAMKVMKEITSTAEGKIVKVLVQDNTPVEYGQPLFEIEPQITTDKSQMSADENQRQSVL